MKTVNFNLGGVDYPAMVSKKGRYLVYLGNNSYTSLYGKIYNADSAVVALMRYLVKG